MLAQAGTHPSIREMPTGVDHRLRWDEIAFVDPLQKPGRGPTAARILRAVV